MPAGFILSKAIAPFGAGNGNSRGTARQLFNVLDGLKPMARRGLNYDRSSHKTADLVLCSLINRISRALLETLLEDPPPQLRFSASFRDDPHFLLEHVRKEGWKVRVEC
jgi:hypothetical protein